MKEALEHAEKLIIGVGSPYAKDKDNPFSFRQRREMLEMVIKKEDLQEKVLSILPLRDYLEDDNLWLKKTLGRVGKIDVVIGNNEWTNGIFERAGYPVLRLGFYKRDLYEGKKIRALMREGREWENRVPKYIAKQIE